MAATLKFVNINTGELYGFLPDHSGLSTQIELNGPGAISLSYLNNGEQSVVIDHDDAVIYVLDDGVLRDDAYLLEDDGDDPTDEAGDARMVTVAGRGTLALLDRAVVYPMDYKVGGGVSGLDPHYYFTEPASDVTVNTGYPTPGHIMLELLRKAQQRGALPFVQVDFDSDYDSLGVVWPEDYTLTLDAGTSLMVVLQNMTDQNWCDAQMKGLTLQMFAPNTALNQDRPNVILRRGREVMSGPRQRSRREIRSALLTVGDENAAAESLDTTAQALYGRREGFLGQGGVTALGTLQRVSDKSLTLLNKTSEGFTVELDLTAGGPQPFIDYGIGDRIRYDQRRLDETHYEPMRVRTMTTTWDDNGIKTASLELNDLFMEQSIRLARKIDGIVNGSSSNTRPPNPPPPGKDRIAPAAPASVSVSTDASVRTNGDVVASAQVDWPAVQLNSDGSVFDDLGYYEIQYNFPGRNTTWSGSQTATDPTVVYYENLPPGERFKAHVRAVDDSGNKSGWTESATITLAKDAQPPPTPGAPTVETMIGGIRVGWNGLGANGEPMPVDFSHCAVHMSTAGTGFTPSSATLAGSMRTAGFLTFGGLDTTQTYFVRLVLWDTHGNASTPSPTAQAQPRKVVSDDMADLIIHLGALADVERASITTDFLDTFNAPDDRWLVRTTGNLTWATVSDAAVGGGVGRVTGPTLYEFNQNIPYDDQQLYRVQCRVRVTNSATPVTFGVGIAGIAYDGQSRVSAANTSSGTDHFPNTSNQAVIGINQWTMIQGFMRGRSTGAATGTLVAGDIGFGAPAGAAENPMKVAAGVKYMRPIFQFNGSTSATWEIDQIQLEQLEIPPNVIGTVMIADGTIVNAKIRDAAIDDAKIGHLSVTTLQSGTLAADTILGGSETIRTSAGKFGQRVVLDPLGIRAYDNANNNNVDINVNGSVFIRGEMQTGPDNQAHVSVKSVLESTMDPAANDGVASIRLWAGHANMPLETQPAILKNIPVDVSDGAVNTPVLYIRSGMRTNASGADAARAAIQVRGAVSGGSFSQIDFNARWNTFTKDERDNPPVIQLRSAEEITGSGQAPLMVGISSAGADRLLLDHHGIQTFDQTDFVSPIRINDLGGGVHIGGQVYVRESPSNANNAWIGPDNNANDCCIVFSRTNGTVLIKSWNTNSFQPIQAQTFVYTGASPHAGDARGSTRRGDPPDDPIGDITDMNVVDVQPPGQEKKARQVDMGGLPDIVVAGADTEDPGVDMYGLLATSIAAQQQMLDKITQLEAKVAALEAG